MPGVAQEMGRSEKKIRKVFNREIQQLAKTLDLNQESIKATKAVFSDLFEVIQLSLAHGGFNSKVRCAYTASLS